MKIFPSSRVNLFLILSELFVIPSESFVILSVVEG